VDTTALCRNDNAKLGLSNGVVLDTERPIITFAARALEKYRGFHKFWPALSKVLRRNPDTEALIVGGNAPVYGPAERTQSLRQTMLQEHPVDLSRVHFVPSLGRADYTRMLQLSRCHVYLTYPFIPSWSLIEAMSCAAPIVAADVAPVREIVDRGTSELVDFFDIEAIAEAMENMIRRPRRYNAMRQRARARAVRSFDFQTKMWPKLRSLVKEFV
jgi:glycosyltransferase involved in cell wall biosynthesis